MWSERMLSARVTGKRAEVRAWRRRALALAIACLLGLATLTAGSGCALFGGDEAFEFPIDVEHDVEVPVDMSTLGPVAGTVTPVAVTLELPAQEIDLAELNEEVADNRDKIVSLSIRQINVTPTTNTLTAALPPMTIAIGPHPGDSGATYTVATIPSIPAGSTQTVEAEIDGAQMNAAGEAYLGQLAFTVLPTVVIPAGQEVPTGTADLNLALEVRVVVDPTR